MAQQEIYIKKTILLDFSVLLDCRSTEVCTSNSASVCNTSRSS